ncbi:MAG: 2-dehydropantoate 2-reductase [Firmicutes bacterium]|nr:2-dehydropantoate 2-reductase [Bacillota bacterium]
MRTAIIGAGSLGTIVGALLSKAGRDVVLVDANPEQVRALNEKGAQVVGHLEMTVPVKAIAPEQMEGIYDLVLYLVKTNFDSVALPQLLPHLGPDSIVLTLQNGLPEDTVAESVGAPRTLGGAVGWGATWISPGVSQLTSPPELMTYDIGELDGKKTERLQRVKEVLEPAGQFIITENLLGIRWTKLLVNSTFSGMSTVLGCTYGDILDNPKALECVAHIANECLQVIAALGVKPELIQGVDVRIMGFKDKEQMKRTFNIYHMAFGPHRALKASMLQDLEKGKPCEIGTINGKVSELGKKAGVATPVNNQVVEIVTACMEGKLKPAMGNLDLFKIPEIPDAPAVEVKPVEAPKPVKSKVPAHKRIVTCAITGSVHIPTMSEYLPITPEQIAQNALDAANAGAASVHIHARDPKTGMPTSDLKVFEQIIDLIRAKNQDVIICLTTGGGAGMTVEQRVSVVPKFKPELASCNLGSMNWGVFAIMEKYKEFKFPWEGAMMEMAKGFIFQNTFADLKTMLTTMAENGTKPELEVYDVGHLYNLAYLVQAGFVKLPVYMQFVTGILGGIAATSYDLMHLHITAERLFGRGNFQWSVIGAGRAEFPICTQGLFLGSHVRVGMEDNLMLNKGELAKSNGDLVEKMVRIMREFDYEPATPAEAREIIGLKS